jgi:hypothetical protein
MKLLKRWQIEKTDLNESDVAWLTGCCNRLQVNNESHIFKNLVDKTGRNIMVPKGQTILVETVSEKQESMLKLKYEGSLTLMRVEHWDERDIQQRIDYYGEDWARTDEY